jgi:hypothetical protein
MTLDRYLKDVRTYLPADQADDIVNELSENLRSQFEDRESALGRALTEAEQEAILTEHGKPLVVAARYRAEEQSFTFGRMLIGPALFPAYTQVLTITFSITFLVVAIGAIIAAGGESLAWQPIVPALSTFALAAVVQFGVITAIFVAAERQIIGDPSGAALEWRTALPSGPQSLLDRIADQLIGRRLGDVVPRRTSVADFAIVAVTVGWLVFIRPPIVIDGLRSGPGLESFHLPLLVVLALSGIQPIVTFLRPRLVAFRSTVRAATDVAVLTLFAMSLNTGRWIEPTDGAAAGSDVATVVSEVNRWVGVSLTVAVLITLVMALFELWRLIMRLRNRSTPAGG